MVGTLFYWFCYAIWLEFISKEREEAGYSQLDMTMRFHDEGIVEFGDWAMKPTLRGLIVGLVSIVRVVLGLGYLGAVVRPDIITRETRLAIDNLLKI